MLKTALATLLGLGLALVACRPGPEPARSAAAVPQSPPAAGGMPPAAAPSPLASPLAVMVEVDAKGGSPSALAAEWAKELRAVLAVNTAQFRLVETAKDADLGVRIEQVVASPESPGHQLLTLWLTVGGKKTRWQLDYTGGPAEMAGRLARFLVHHVQQASAPGSPSPASSSPASRP